MKEQVFQKIQKTIFLLNKIWKKDSFFFWTNGFTEWSFSEKKPTKWMEINHNEFF